MTIHLAEEHRTLQELVARFVDEHLVPLEPRIIERDIRGEHPKLTEDEEALAARTPKSSGSSAATAAACTLWSLPRKETSRTVPRWRSSANCGFAPLALMSSIASSRQPSGAARGEIPWADSAA